MMAVCVLRGWTVPSQNVTMRRHWSRNAKERKTLERWIRSIVGVNCAPTTKRYVHIHSVRRQLIRDDANLRGGSKGLVDAIVAAGLLVDDSDEWATITYTQETCKGMKPSTTVIVADEPIITIDGVPLVLEDML